MRLYTVDEELRVRLERDVREWTTAGMLTAEQARALEPDLATDLRRTGPMLRSGLAMFTLVAGGAAIGLVMLVTDLTSSLALAITTAVLGTLAMAAASWLVRRFRLYRYGVEEALAMGAVALFGASAGVLGGEVFHGTSDAGAWSVAMIAVAIASGYTYRRFGYRDAAVVALTAVALVPMAFDALGVETTRVFAAVVFAGGYAYAANARRSAGDDITRGDAEVVRAAAAVGGYAALNVCLTGEPPGPSSHAWFTWTTWAITWILPVVVGRAAVRGRDPWLLRVAAAMTLASLVTNKTYLGWPRQPWDPMLLGVLLSGLALVLRRWLAAGANGERHGFTARQLTGRDAAALQLASLASAAVHPGPTRDVQDAKDPVFSGGRSGGGGAGGEF